MRGLLPVAMTSALIRVDEIYAYSPTSPAKYDGVAPMNRSSVVVAACVVLAGIGFHAIAQSQASATSTNPPAAAGSAQPSSKPTPTARVEAWTKKQWDAAQK